MRLKIGEVLPVARTHIFESRAQAQSYLDKERK
ncbi:hypothetical protein ROLI_029150 [Roseobacter fucihabitans]|uniref:Uncharacterized protein n=1 Tax=Roseobacter fucihabitans TaxID=1537242 RepID=A0ABZ2BUY6_9RHOB|nr:hypothetical protein [Roseobacter litoralis]